jgi:lipopolysaccharide transport system ATP-binding protein
MMNPSDLAIRVENISKRYRIGIKEEMRDNFAGAFFAFIKSPLRNYRKYRSLYKFENISGLQTDDGSEDIIWALRDISFEVKKGEVLGIIGRNGAGKSTLLKILCKVTDPTEGAAEIRGRVSSLLEVGTGFHQELTGRENIYLNGTVLGMTKKEVDRKFDEIVDFSGVEKFIETPVKRYSSGMRVRLAFSVAAHLEPEILLIDEVLAVGDADFQKKCLKKMEDVGRKGRTVLFVSHNMPAVNRLCHRAILLENGRLVDDGLASKIINKYLVSDQNTSAVREWQNSQTAPSGTIARLRAVRIRNEDGKITDSIDIRCPTKIEMEYEVQESGHILMPHFALRDEKGVTVFVTVDQDPEWRNRPRPKGYFISSVLIPGNLLAEGPHFVNCHLITLKPEVKQFSERNVVSFTVIDCLDGDSARGDYAKNFPGVVRPLLNWVTEYNPYTTQNDKIKSE